MSDVMLLGVLRMPMEDPDPMTLFQFLNRARAAADRIEADAVALDELRQRAEKAERMETPLCEQLDALRKDAERYRWLRDNGGDWAICHWRDDDREGLGVMDADAKRARAQMLLAQEQNEPQRLWWLSFCEPGKPKGQQFLGVIVTEAPGFMHAHQRVCMLGINPGGEIQGTQVEGIGPEYRDRLLSRAELEAAGLV